MIMNMKDGDDKAFDFEQDDREIAQEEEQREMAQFQEDESDSEKEAPDPKQLLESGDERVPDAEEPEAPVPEY